MLLGLESIFYDRKGVEMELWIADFQGYFGGRSGPLIGGDLRVRVGVQHPSPIFQPKSTPNTPNTAQQIFY